MSWIFQKIVDIKNVELYGGMRSGLSLSEATKNYNETLRKNVDAETYVRYCLYQCDIYVDVTCIQVAAKNVYRNITDKQVVTWLNKHKKKHHILIS